MKVRAIGSVCAVVSLAACGKSSVEPACPQVLLPAIAISVIDAHTLSAPAAQSKVYLADGSFRDSSITYTDPAGAHKAFVAYGRPGRYSVLVQTPGYADWNASGVDVQADACGQPRTVLATASLQTSGH
ncbi:MAG: hypothetical protein HY059_06030 [Proteobacteria bacterium]|nr:hypothetical protein [Pseudomonadota bacterium]